MTRRRFIDMTDVLPGEWRSAETVRRNERFLDSLGPVKQEYLPPVEQPHPNPIIGFLRFLGGVCLIMVGAYVVILLIGAIMGD